MSESVLDLINIISVSLQSAPSGLGLPILNRVALFSGETPSWNTTYKEYVSASPVATDFGTNSKAYKLATAFFSQQPNPLNTGGSLVIIPLVGGTEDLVTALNRVEGVVFFGGVIIDKKLTGQQLSDFSTAMQAVDKLFIYASDDKADFAPGGALDLVRQGAKTHTRCLYYNDGTAIDTQAMAAAYAARAMSTDFTGSRTTQTMNLKALATVTPDGTIQQTDKDAADTAGVDVYASIAGVASVVSSGNNGFFDEVYNELALKLDLETAGFNYLRQTNTKVPQTEEGMEGLKNEYRKVLQQYVGNGFLAPGAWTSPDTFGDGEALVRSIKDIGYYVYSQPVAQQLNADRQARKAPLIQMAIKAAGAIHKSSVIVEVNL